MKIGFAGLGGMGSAMAANLLQAGYGVTVWNRSPQAAQPLVSAGAVQARQPEELAEVDVLITMLANDTATEQVVVERGAQRRLYRRTGVGAGGRSRSRQAEYSGGGRSAVARQSAAAV